MVSNTRAAAEEWAHKHIDLALRLCYGAAAAAFVASLLLFRHPVLLGVLIGFAASRGILLIAEWFSESVQIENIRTGDYGEALRRPGMSAARQVQVLMRLVSDRQNRPLAERTASFVGYCIDSGFEEAARIARAFEGTWGVPPHAGENQGLVRALVERGFRFTMSGASVSESEIPVQPGIPWAALWREKLFHQLSQEHPGERLPRLLLRIYAAEWQSVLTPVWVIIAIVTLFLLSQHWLSTFDRGVLSYTMFGILGLSALWLAFVLRPAAFNASLLAGDMDRCAQWVMDSTEGRHYLVAALGSAKQALRHQAVKLLLWHDALLSADITLPEGMLAFSHREGTPRRSRRKFKIENSESAKLQGSDYSGESTQVSNRQVSNRQAADRQSADRQSADRQSADRQSADRQAADRQAADRQAADHAGDSPAGTAQRS